MLISYQQSLIFTRRSSTLNSEPLPLTDTALQMLQLNFWCQVLLYASKSRLRALPFAPLLINVILLCPVAVLEPKS